MSKIFAISSTGKSEKSFLDLRFGKCEYITIFNRSSDQLRMLENPFKNTDHSGVQLLSMLKKEGVTTIITGEIGPLVSNSLEKENIQLVLLHEEKIKIEEIIERLKNQG